MRTYALVEAMFVAAVVAFPHRFHHRIHHHDGVAVAGFNFRYVGLNGTSVAPAYSTGTAPVSSTGTIPFFSNSTKPGFSTSALSASATGTAPTSVSPTSLPVFTTTATPPDSTPEGGNSKCGKFYKVQSDDTCSTVASKNNLSVEQFLALNPTLDSQCTNLWLNYDYCVATANSPGTVSVSSTGTIPFFSNSTKPGFSTSALSASATGTAPTSVSPTSLPVFTTTATPPDSTPEGGNSKCGKFYKVQSDDTCSTVASKNSLSVEQFLALNPTLDSQCTNLWLNYDYCVATANSPGTASVSSTGTIPFFSNSTKPGFSTSALSAFATGTAPTSVSPTSLPVSATTAPPPDSTPEGGNSKCGKFYKVQFGDKCSTVASKNSLSVEQFLALNPTLDSQCTNLWLNYNYCVATASSAGTIPVSNGTTPVSSTSAFSSFPIGTAPTTTVAPTSLPVFTTTATPPDSTLEGGNSKCGKFYKVQSDDTCSTVASKNNLSVEQFLALNPTLDSQCTNLWLNYNYCVATANSAGATPVSSNGITSVSSASALSSFLTGTAPTSVSPTSLPVSATTAPPPDSTPEGGNSKCGKFYKVQSDDTCSMVASKNNLGVEQFLALNPTLDSQCTNLWLNYNYCVATANSAGATPVSNGITSVSSASALSSFLTGTAPTTTVAPTSLPVFTTIATPPDSTPEGGNSKCGKFYKVQSGDTCSKVASNNNLSVEKFFALNPTLDSQCTNLWLNYDYCVAPVSSTT